MENLPNIDFDSLTVLLLEEKKLDENVHYLEFKIEEVLYQMIINKRELFENLYYITLINHLYDECPFCHRAKNKPFCTVAYAHKGAIFNILLKQSKNRLKWVTREMM